LVDKGLTCFCCGVCCSKYQVQMTIDEAHKIANKLRIDWEKFEEDYLDNSWPGVRTVLLRHKDGHCLFLQPQPDGKVFFCRVHQFKPESCIQWNADLNKKDCREGLSKYWKLHVDEEGKIAGEAGDVEAFDTLLGRLKA
jgi:Fe-S-cluster containining protein